MKEFTCDICCGTFKASNTEHEREEQFVYDYGVPSEEVADEIIRVCRRCYNLYRPEY